ncbi:uncharacterized protein PRD47_016907 [Ara ararauna]
MCGWCLQSPLSETAQRSCSISCKRRKLVPDWASWLEERGSPCPRRQPSARAEPLSILRPGQTPRGAGTGPSPGAELTAGRGGEKKRGGGSRRGVEVAERRNRGRARDRRRAARRGRWSGGMRRCRAAALAGLAAVLLAAVGRAQVQQDPSAETTEGTGISINCSHPNLRSNDFIVWYRQLPGRGPTFLVSLHKGFKELVDPKGRLSVAADRRSSVLWLAKPGRRDAAVYYCAQQARREEPGLRPSKNRRGRGRARVSGGRDSGGRAREAALLLRPAAASGSSKPLSCPGAFPRRGSTAKVRAETEEGTETVHSMPRKRAKANGPYSCPPHPRGVTMSHTLWHTLQEAAISLCLAL